MQLHKQTKKCDGEKTEGKTKNKQSKCKLCHVDLTDSLINVWEREKKLHV